MSDKLQVRMPYATLEIYRRWCESRGTSPQDDVRQMIHERMGGGPNFPLVPESIVSGVLREVRDFAKKQANTATVQIDAGETPQLELPSPMGPCPNESCPSRDEDWPERLIYGGDQPLISVSGGRYRCNACGTSGP